jgi:prephenate dehydrogenase
MEELLPPMVDITCVHPLFGPQSARLGLAGRRLVICPQRGDRHVALARLAQAKGLVVRLTDPHTHDQEMAHVQALTHLIAITQSPFLLKCWHFAARSSFRGTNALIFGQNPVFPSFL